MACTSDSEWLQRMQCDGNTSTCPVHQTVGDFKEHSDGNTSTWPVHQTVGDFNERSVMGIPQHGLYIRQWVTSTNAL